MEKIKHYTLVLLTGVSGFILVLSLIAAVVLNSGMLDRYAQQQMIALFNKEFFGRLELRAVHLNFPNRVTLVAPEIYEPGSSSAAFSAKNIKLRFNFLMLLQPEIRRLSFRKISADSLQATVIEREDGKRNIDVIFTSRNPDSSRAPLESFFCKKLSVENGSLSWIKNSADKTPQRYRAEDIDLKITSFRLKENLFSGVLEKGAFALPSHAFRLREGSAKFHFSTSRSELLALKAESGRSSAELSVSIDDFNIFAPDGTKQFIERLTASRSFININALHLHTADIKIFYPGLLLPEGLYHLKGNAKVADGSLQVFDSRITRGKSRLALKGELLHLRQKDALSFRVVCDSSTIEPVFLKALFAETPYEKAAEQLGTVTFLGRAEGSPKQAETSIDLITGIGRVSLEAESKGAMEKQLSWKGTFTLAEVEAYRFLEASGRKSGKNLLRATGAFEGVSQGVKSLERLSLSADIKDSFWERQDIQKGSLTVDYNRKVLKTGISLQNLAEFLDASGEIDLNNPTPLYKADGRIKKIDLSKTLNSRNFVTDLNGTFALKGEGFDPRSLNAAVAIRFEPSSINEFRLRDKSELAVAIAQREASSQITVKSDFLDASLSGDYSLKQLLGAVQLAGYGITREIRTQSLWPAGLPAIESPPVPQPDNPFKVTYRIAVRNVTPLIVLLPVRNMALQGSTEGELLYRKGLCTISSSFDIISFSGGSGTALNNLAASTVMEYNRKGLSTAALKGKVAELSITGVKSGNLAFEALYTPARLSATLDGELPEQAWKISSALSARRSGETYDITLNKFSMGNSEGLWQIPADSRIALGSASATFNSLSIAKGSQRVVLDGQLSSNRAGTFKCTFSNIDLAGFNRNGSAGSPGTIAGVVNGTLTVNGSPGAKTSTLSLAGRGIRYEGLLFGSMQFNARHNGSRLGFDFRSAAAPSGETSSLAMNAIEGKGSMPLFLSYVPFQVRVPDQQPVSASFRSDNLSARFLEYVLPFFENAEGIIPTTLTISGRTPKPDIYLTTRLRDTRITVEPTQVTYILNGDVEVNPRQVELKEIAVRDLHQGSGRISGLIRLVQLEPRSLELGASCSKLLLYNKKDRKDETSFGTVTGTTRNIRLHGDLSAPVVEGGMRIDNADFSLYRTGANESAKYVGAEKFIEFVPRYPSEKTENSGQNGSEKKPAEFYYSLIDILQIRDLKLSSIEPLKYTVIFDRLRGEELEASIGNLYLIVNKSNQRYRLYGSVNITDGKYRFSNTNFDLEDGGKITWNNAEIREGRMDNLYGTKYLSVTSSQTGERDNVRLLLAITGTLNEPRVGMGYYLNEQMQPYASQSMIGGQPSQIDPNAELNVLSMLLSKQWYAPPGSSGQYGSLEVSSAGLSTGAGLVSSQLSRIVQNIAGIESFNVNLGLDKKGELSGLDLYFAVNIPGTNGKVRFVGTGSSPDIKDKALFNYYGTSQKIEYRVTPKVYLEAYRSYGQLTGEASNTNLQKPSETWGASISYRERFHTWEQFWKRIAPSSDEKK
ncbi:MAG: translocation/assembly module TamB [Chlorobium sp.]|uniref:translocation/assembly module TamB domain-containing protein n=1 Tax=Chlorobium sp. TaxID=1095 RepID=UPI0025BE6CE8|nr:translocation/assembly module TamB domain-containing protein [Chlorobium sp.]MCF8383969.1 translocation/assembly module TamB [Chlorobium sp.]